MDGLRSRPQTARLVGVALYLCALPLVALLALPGRAEVDRVALSLVLALCVAHVASLVLFQPTRAFLRASVPVAQGLAGLVVLATGGAESPFLGVLVLPLVFAAAILSSRDALPTAGVFLLGVGTLVATIDDVEGVAPLVVETVVDLAVAGLVAAWSARHARVVEIDALRSRVAGAAGTADLEDALRRLLRGDVVAASLLVVDGAPPRLATVLAAVGEGAGASGRTIRLAPEDSLALSGIDVIGLEPGGRSGDLLRAAGAGAARSLAVLPLADGGRVVGQLVLASRRPRAFPPRRLGLLAHRLSRLGEALGAHLVRVERDARLRSALAVRELAGDLAEAGDADEVLRLGARRLAALVEADAAWLLRPVDGAADCALDGLPVVGDVPPVRIDGGRSAGTVRTAMHAGTPVWDADPARSGLPLEGTAGAVDVEAALCVPLPWPGGALGGVCCVWRTPRIVRPGELDLAAFVAGEVAAAWRRAEADERLRRQATRDPLTGLLNHAAFHEEVERALAGISRGRGPVVLILADLDHLKHLNDFHGHAAGDAALRATADVLRTVARREDAVGRLGGDEFGWLLVGSTPDDGLAAAERAVALVGETRVEPVGFLSLSAGVAVVASTTEAETLFERADAALYEAKARGRGVAEMARLAGGAGRGPLDPPADLPHARLLADASDRRSALEAVAREWVDLFHCAACGVSLVEDGSRLRDVAFVDSGRPWEGGRVHALDDRPAPARALAEGRPYACSVGDPEADAAEVAVLREAGFASLLLVPIRGPEGPLGAIELLERRRRTFSADEQRFALALADYAGAVVGRLLD